VSGSARPKRRRAAGAGLRYEPVRGRVAVSRGPGREPKVKWDAVLRWVVVITVTLEIFGLGLVTIFWVRNHVWGGLASAWPGGPYGLAATAGLLVPPTIAALVVTLKRVKWPEDKAGSLKWIAASLPAQAMTAALSVVLYTAMRPRRLRGRGPECRSEGGACWLREEYPYLWAIIWGTALLAGAAVLGVRFLYRRRRAAAGTSNSPPQHTA